MDRDDNTMIFISHSSADIQKVRMIRNTLEENGYDPILFHLGCMDSDSYDAMSEEELLATPLFTLIRQEIAARHLFVYCDSEASRHSRYVQLERKFVEQQSTKAVLRIDLKDDDDVIRHRIRQFLTGSTLFLHYCADDREFAARLRSSLNTHESIYVWTPGNHNLHYDADAGTSVIGKGLQATVHADSWYIPILSRTMAEKYHDDLAGRLSEPDLRIVPLLFMDKDELCELVPAFRPYRGYAVDCRDDKSAEEIDALIRDRIRRYNEYREN